MEQPAKEDLAAVSAKLLPYLSQLVPIDKTVLESLSQEIKAAEIDWQEPYPDYGSQGMKIQTLLNTDGRQDNFVSADCRAPQATPLLQSLPRLKNFIENLGFSVMASRLLRLDPGTFLHEHRDFVYLENVPRFRLHVPLITNEQAFIVTPGINVHFRSGYLWKLDPKQTIHSACNFGTQPRIHVMLDCYGNEKLDKLIDNQYLDEENIFFLPAFTEKDKETVLSHARSLLTQGNLQAAEDLILRLFCQYNLQVSSPQSGTTYDLMFELFAGSESLSGRKKYWQDRLVETYPERKAGCQ